MGAKIPKISPFDTPLSEIATKMPYLAPFPETKYKIKDYIKIHNIEYYEENDYTSSPDFLLIKNMIYKARFNIFINNKLSTYTLYDFINFIFYKINEGTNRAIYKDYTYNIYKNNCLIFSIQLEHEYYLELNQNNKYYNEIDYNFILRNIFYFLIKTHIKLDDTYYYPIITNTINKEATTDIYNKKIKLYLNIENIYYNYIYGKN